MSAPSGGLLARHCDFVTALRTAGLPVSVAEDIDAATVLQAVDLLDREQVRVGYAAALVKRHIDRPMFDTIFDLYFPARLGGEPPEPTASTGVRRDDPALREFRERLQAALQSGDDDALARLAGEGVARFGAVPGTRVGTQSWSSYSAQTRISPQTLMAALLENALSGRVATGLDERVARTAFEQRIARFRRLLDTEVQRRVAEQAGPTQVARTAVRPSIDRVDLQSATQADLAAIRREIEPLARRLAARVAIEHRRGRRGPLDFRRTIRASLSSGGTPIQTEHHPRRPRRTDLVILCDVSESVSSFARFTLLLVYALRQQFSRVRVFAFVDDLDEVTDYFRPGVDVADALTRLATEAKVYAWYGRTDYGRAFGLFTERHLEAITGRTSVLVLGDARSNYGDPGLPALQRIAEQARRVYWLNPERRSAWDTGDSVADAVGRIVPMLECRNLAQLGRFVRDLA
jgi:uncharacterized protein with von Willebrand factor type A (vWA) domain